MAKNKVEIDVKVDDKGTTKKVGLEAKKASEGLDATAKSSRTTDRNLKGAAQTSANSSKNFSKMAQGITGGLVPAYATLAANIFAISAAFNFFKRAADVSVLIDAQKSYAAATGVGLQGITSSLREASGGMLTFREAASAAAIGVAKGFSTKQLEDLAVGARKASAALGRDFEDAFDRLIRGTSKAEPELLDELGITLRLEKATSEYATAIGKNVKELTAYERSQAVLVETQRQLDEQFGNVDAAVNPFQQLAVTFNDIVKSVTQFLLPVFEAFASLINKSAYAAIAVFGALGVSILKAAIPFDVISEKVDAFKNNQAQAVEEAKTKVNEYTEALKRNAAEIKQLNESASENMQKNAKTLVKGGSDSKILQKVAQGQNLTGQDKANLEKALKSAEAQYKKHGKIKTGIFKAADIEIVRSFETSFRRMEATSKTSTTKIGLQFQKLRAQVSLAATQMQQKLSTAFMGAAKAASIAGKVMNSALRFAGVVGIVVIVIEALVSLKNNIFDISLQVINIAENIFNTVKEGIAKLVSGAIEKLGALGGLLGFEDFEAKLNSAAESVKEFGKAGKLTTKEDLLGTLVGVLLNDIQETGRAAEASKEALDNFNSGIKTFKSDFEQTATSIREAREAGDKYRESIIRLNATSTSGIEGQLDIIRKISNPTDRKNAYETLKASILELREVFPALARVVEQSGDSYGQLEQNLRATIVRSSEAKVAQTALNEAITSTRQIVQRGSADLYGLREAYKTVNDAAEEATRTAALAGESIDGVAKASDNLGYNIKDALGEVEGLLQRQRDIQKEISQQNIAETQNSRYSPELQKALNERLNVERLLTQEKQLQLEIDRLNLQLQNLSKGAAGDPTVLEDQIATKQQKLRELQAKIGEEQRSISDIGKIGDAAADTFESSFISAFDGIIQGTLSVKDAFKNMAVSILKALSQVIAKLLVVKLLEAAIGAFSFGGAARVDAAQAGTLQSVGIPDAGIVATARYGGMFKPAPGYAAGGIAKGRDAGYPAILHGTEAVVPLPNGNAIPVEMRNGMGQQNNVTVNVSVDSNGNAQQNTQTDSQQGANLGNAIAAAVQKELQNQKRSGGILNPYGVA